MRLLRSQLSNTATYVIHQHITMFGWTSAVNCDTNLPQLVGWINHQLIFFIPNFWKELKFRLLSEVPLRNDRWCFTDCCSKGTLVTCAAQIFYFQLWDEGVNYTYFGLAPHSRWLFLDSWFWILSSRIYIERGTLVLHKDFKVHFWKVCFCVLEIP